MVNTPQQPGPGYSPALVDMFQLRRASTRAAFLLPHLRAGMSLLDCGCGPGTVTIGLAEAVAPGQVVGIDLDARSLAMAEKNLAESQVRNLRFQNGDVYSIPFEDNSFDAVHAGSVTCGLAEPMTALREMRRVLKPGGVIGIRNPEYSGFLIWPPCDALRECYNRLQRNAQSRGQSLGFSMNSLAVLREAGFVRREASASYECLGVNVEVDAWMLIFQAWLDRGLSDHATVQRLEAELRAWGQNPDAFFGRPGCEAIGYKEG